jgi:hypothetical protein
MSFLGFFSLLPKYEYLTKIFFKLNLYFELAVDSHAVVRKCKEIAMYSVPLMITSCKTIDQYYNQNTDINAIC